LKKLPQNNSAKDQDGYADPCSRSHVFILIALSKSQLAILLLCRRL
jgi:hypothetical protein